MKRLSRREVMKLAEALGVEIKEKVYSEEFSGVKLYLFGDGRVPKLAELKGRVVPTFYYKELLANLPKIVVDRGAAEALRRGADLMAPGVLSRPEAEPGSLALVVDPEDKPVAIVEVVTKELPPRGKVARTLHALGEGDRIIKAIRERRKRGL